MRIKDITGIDFALLGASLVLIVFGILFVYSSGLTSTGELVSAEYARQIAWGAGGLVVALFLALFDYRKIYSAAFYIYAGMILLLIYTCLAGRYVNGARAWIGIGSFGIQPSEFAKLTTILFLAQYLDNSKSTKNNFSRFIISCIISFIPMGIILLQPDLGTALVFFPILIVMLFIAGVPVRYLLFMILCAAGASIFLILPLWQDYISKTDYALVNMLENNFFLLFAGLFIVVGFIISLIGYFIYKKKYFYWICYITAILLFSLSVSYAARKILKEYQIARLIVFLNPEIDSRGAGWHIIQSIIAIGAGGLWGRGYLQGTQSHYRFLPYQSTDFIFSIFAEEWGFLGGLLVFALFLLILWRLIKIISLSVNTFGMYIASGVAAVYFFHFAVNVGMAMGIMPITGIPLLFMSYGGSALFSAMAGIGLCLSVYVRRFERSMY